MPSKEALPPQAPCSPTPVHLQAAVQLPQAAHLHTKLISGNIPLPTSTELPRILYQPLLLDSSGRHLPGIGEGMPSVVMLGGRETSGLLRPCSCRAAPLSPISLLLGALRQNMLRPLELRRQSWHKMLSSLRDQLKSSVHATLSPPLSKCAIHRRPAHSRKNTLTKVQASMSCLKAIFGM